jgi:hypothetical protein
MRGERFQCGHGPLGNDATYANSLSNDSQAPSLVCSRASDDMTLRETASLRTCLSLTGSLSQQAHGSSTFALDNTAVQDRCQAREARDELDPIGFFFALDVHLIV